MKSFEPSDPMEVVAVSIPDGDQEYMAECLVEEYLLLGWSERQLKALFTRPFFQMTHQLYRERGEAWVRSLITRVCDRWSRGAPSGGPCDA
jgi:hypothetical protein